MPPDGDIAALLRDEIAAVQRFVQLLQTEQGFLQTGATDELTRCTGQKSVLAEGLVRLATARNEKLRAAGHGTDNDGLKQWAGVQGQAAAELHQRLLELAREARELNRLNGQLIAMRLSHTHAALAALSPERAASSLYGRDGQTNARTGYRIIDSA